MTAALAASGRPAAQAATMLAARVSAYGGSDQVALATVARPAPGPGEILVRVAAVGVNPIDWKMREGNFAPPVPFVPGQDLAGIVDALGDGAEGFQVGDPVYGMLGLDRVGAYAEYVAAPDGWFARKPEGSSFEEAAALPMGALTAWVAVFDIGGLAAGQRLLVHGGAGAVGSMAVQLAKARGAFVAATASGPGLARVAALGADLVIDYRAERFEDALRATGEGVDLVLDTLAGETRERSWSVLREGGAVVSTLGATEPPPAARARGARGLPGFGTGPDGRRLAELARLVDAGTVRPTVAEILPLARAAEAMDLNQTGRAAGKVVIQVTDPSANAP